MGDQQNYAAARQSAGRRQAGAVRGTLSRSASLLAQLGPVFETLSDLAFEAALWRIVELMPPKRFRKIILTGERVRDSVIVGVAGAVAFVLHQPGRRIEDVFRWQQRAGVFCRAHRRTERGIGGVRLGCGGD